MDRIKKRIGSFRYHGILQSPSITRGANGEPLTSWNDEEEVWIAIENMSGFEKFVNKKETAKNVYKITFRTPSVSLNETWRLVLDDGRVMGFLAVQTYYNGLTRCDCEEILDGSH